jgi:hypothetical protein
MENEEFHLDVVCSAMLGKFLTSQAARDYGGLASYLFENAKDFPIPTPFVLQAYIMYGLIDEHPDIYRKVKYCFDSGMVNSTEDLIPKLTRSLDLEEPYVAIQPFQEETIEKFKQFDVPLQNFYLQLCNLQYQTGGVYLPPDLLNMLSKKPYESHLTNVSDDEANALVKFEDLTFANAAQQNILSICKSARIPVTPESFAKHTDNEITIEIPTLYEENFLKELEAAGINSLCNWFMELVDEKSIYTINMKALDSDIAKQLDTVVKG